LPSAEILPSAEFSLDANVSVPLPYLSTPHPT
jgi:hypothetical protein